MELPDEEAIHSELVDGFGTFEDPEELPSQGMPISQGPPVPQQGPPASPQQTRGILNRILPAVFSGQRQAEPIDTSPPLKNGLLPEVRP